MSKYDGDATISENGERFRVQIEAPNVRAEVYIDRAQAAEIRDTLNHALRHWPSPDSDKETRNA